MKTPEEFKLKFIDNDDNITKILWYDDRCLDINLLLFKENTEWYYYQPQIIETKYDEAIEGEKTLVTESNLTQNLIITLLSKLNKIEREQKLNDLLK